MRGSVTRVVGRSDFSAPASRFHLAAWRCCPGSLTAHRSRARLPEHPWAFQMTLLPRGSFPARFHQVEQHENFRAQAVALVGGDIKAPVLTKACSGIQKPIYP